MTFCYIFTYKKGREAHFLKPKLNHSSRLFILENPPWKYLQNKQTIIEKVEFTSVLLWNSVIEFSRASLNIINIICGGVCCGAPSCSVDSSINFNCCCSSCIAASIFLFFLFLFFFFFLNVFCVSTKPPKIQAWIIVCVCVFWDKSYVVNFISCNPHSENFPHVLNLESFVTTFVFMYK